VQFNAGFDVARYRKHAARTNAAAAPVPLSLYFHIPFCATVCFYCACNKVVTKNQAHTVRYLDCLTREIEQQGALFDKTRRAIGCAEERSASFAWLAIDAPPSSAHPMGLASA
jgi:oxygen-independent coproporphyrinogen-3 oxidase